MPRIRVYGDPARLADKAAGKVAEEIGRKLDEALDAAVKILDAAKTRVLERLERELSSIYREVEERVRAERATREAEIRVAELKARDEWISRAVEEALKRIREKVGEEKYRELLARLLREAAESLREHGDEMVVEPTESDSRLLRELVATMDLPVRVRIAEKHVEGHGGFVASTPDGRIRLDYRLETLLSEAIEEARAAVAKQLFG